MPALWLLVGILGNFLGSFDVHVGLMCVGAVVNVVLEFLTMPFKLGLLDFTVLKQLSPPHTYCVNKTTMWLTKLKLVQLQTFLV